MLSFATIVYAKDYPLLELQARSMAQFAPFDQVASISIIMNDVDEPQLRSALRDVLPAYGPLQDKVRVISGDDILLPTGRQTSPRPLERFYVDSRHRIPLVRRQGWRGNNGYRLQQALKLASVRCCQSDRIVLLDAKNVFLRGINHADFFTMDGKGKLAFMPPSSDFHRNWLEQSLAALDMNQSVETVAQTTTFATPYPVNGALLTALLDEIETRYGSVQALFASKRRPSEFMLINAYCLKHSGSPDAWFEEAHPINIGLWPDYTPEKLDAELDRLHRPDALSLGVHNRAVAVLSPEQRGRLLAALKDRGICDVDQATAILRRTGALTG